MSDIGPSWSSCSYIFYYVVIEVVGPKDGERNVKVKFDDNRKKIHVTDTGRKPLRMIDLRHVEKIYIRLSTDKQETFASVRVPGDIDLVSETNFKIDKAKAWMEDTFSQYLSGIAG